jgi:hypothetical protein
MEEVPFLVHWKLALPVEYPTLVAVTLLEELKRTVEKVATPLGPVVLVVVYPAQVTTD